jgi:hypothetical protein
MRTLVSSLDFCCQPSAFLKPDGFLLCSLTAGGV